MEFAQHYIVAAALFVAIDAVWLKFLANKFYKDHLGDLLAKHPKIMPAIAFYLLYILGIVIFAVQPGAGTQSLWAVLGRGALLGLIMYATYDLTNMSTLKKWPTKVTYVDLAWGAGLTALVAALTYILV